MVWVEVAGTVVTTVGVLVALGIALRGEQVRRAERDAERLAQARTFRVRGQGGQERQPTADDPNTREFHWYAEHHGETPVFDVYYEAWWGGQQLSERPWSATHLEVAQPGESADQMQTLAVEPGRDFTLAAWRVRWSDKFGNQWFVDESLRQTDGRPYSPRRYVEGMPPSPY